MYKLRFKENGCDTWAWHKTTHTFLLLNFDASCPLKWKSGLISCLLNRAKAICSFKLLFQNDVIKLWQMFLSNGYLIWFFNKFLQPFLTVDNDLSDREHSKINPVVYLNVPYIGKEFRCFVGRLAKLFHVKFDVKVSAIYKTFKMGTSFQLKSCTPLLLCSNVVYKFAISKGKRDVRLCENYRSIKLLEHGMKVIERIFERRLWKVVKLDEMQIGFMPGRGSTDAIFIMRQLLEKYEMAGRDIYIWYLWILRKPLIMFQER